MTRHEPENLCVGATVRRTRSSRRPASLAGLVEHVLQLLDLRLHRAGAAPGGWASLAPCERQAVLDRCAGACERQEGGRPTSCSRSEARRCATGSRTASGDTPRTPRAAGCSILCRGRRAGGAVVASLSPLYRAGSAGIFPARRAKETPDQKPSSRRAIGGPDCLRRRRPNRPFPHQRSWTAISAETLSTLLSGRGCRRRRGRLAVARRWHGRVQGSFTCFGGMVPSSKLQCRWRPPARAVSRATTRGFSREIALALAISIAKCRAACRGIDAKVIELALGPAASSVARWSWVSAASCCQRGWRSHGAESASRRNSRKRFLTSQST